MNIGTHKKQSLALYCALINPRLFKQTSDFGYYWKANKRIHTTMKILNNQNEMLKFAKVDSVKRERITDDTNNLSTTIL